MRPLNIFCDDKWSPYETGVHLDVYVECIGTDPRVIVLRTIIDVIICF